VANGWDEAKEASKLIIESNDNDGVARTVERLILNR
jgi:hydroxymethylpyrimidine pyrophosphatase-like HAD family hydrolase